MPDADLPLDDRKERILREIVEGYVRHGEPVGSKAVADDSELGVSSATVRNEMSVLEREGYISHPHTSAGRIPTDKGYRYYVDRLTPRARALPEVRRDVEDLLVGTLSALDDILKQASRVLAELTSYASLASAPPAGEANLSHVHLVPLGGRRAFVIAVGEGSWHEERTIDLPAEPDAAELSRAAEAINRVAAGRPLAAAADALDEATRSSEAPALFGPVAEALRVMALRSARVFTGGAAHVLLWEPGPEAQRVLELLEGPQVGGLLAEPEPEEVAVRIGRELGLSDLDDLSLIASGYRLGRRVGALGVLGPTRMDYPAVIATVGEVARSLETALRQLESS